MKKTNKNSRIEIWQGDYINYPSNRNGRDKNSIILQIESTGNGDYMVELIDSCDLECSD